jgi:hypothetical protein
VSALPAEERALFEQSIRQAAARHTGGALDAALVDVGWTDALDADRYTAISTLFPAQGAANATSCALDQVVAVGLGLPATTVGVVLPALGQWRAPCDGARVHGVATRAPAAVEHTVVATTDGRVATVAASSLTVRAVDGIDPGFGLFEVTAEAIDVTSAQPNDRWDDTVALAQLAVGHEMMGAARTMLTLAREHALDRVQFGKAIAQFQAVRHRLAETLVAIEGAEALLAAASETPSPELAAMAKSVAGRSARTAARHCQQVLAGIGFTTEHAFHRFFRRVLLLDQLFGSAHALTEELGATLLRTRRLPALLPL